MTPKDVSAIAAKVDPALVDINSTFAFQRAGGAGTGIVISARGEVITNNHVIDGATRIRVTDVGNGQTYKAVVMGYDPIHDIAVLQMKDASGLATAPLGDSSNLTVGAPVVAIGNALGSGGAPTSASGVITALHQSISASDEIDGMTEQLSGLIEVNANVQSGDSGGSLVDAGGKVIGMDVAALTGSGFQNRASAGYAILINQVLSVVRRIESGKPTRVIHVGPTAFLGILIATPSILGSGGFGNAITPKSTGVVVSRAVTKGPAALAGIGNGDIVTSLAGQQVDSPASLLKVLIPRHPNDKVVVDWTGPTGVSHRSLVTLGSGPPA